MPARPAATRRARRLGPLPLLLLAGCTHGLFSGIDYPDRSRPVARIETRGGVEFGATTERGVLFLGRTAREGPCRVHFFLGPQPTPLVEDGVIQHWGGVYYTADIDLKTQRVPLLEREVLPSDALVAVLHLGAETRDVPVELARDGIASGDVLQWPGESLPAGTGIFALLDERYHFVGLVAGEAEIQTGGATRRYIAFTGVDRLREALAQPQPDPRPERFIYRPDDITVIKR